MSRLGKKDEPLPVSSGIRGILRKYLETKLIDAIDVPGQKPAFKILVMDDEGTKIVNSCFKMHDIMSRNVTLVVPLKKPRQPVKSVPALYFVAPTAENMAYIVKDWENPEKPMYKDGPNLFITTALSDQVMGRIAGSKAAEVCQKMVDLGIHFMSPEHLFFDSAIHLDIASFFGSHASAQKINEVAEKLTSALLIAEERPAIRCYNNDLCKAVAGKVSESLNRQAAAGANTSGTLIIVDRAIDMIAPLVHEFTYEAFVQDVLPIPDNILEVKGSTETRKVLVDMDDEVWCNLRHNHVAELGQKIADEWKRLTEKYPKLMDFQGKSSASTKDLGDAVRDLPAFNAAKLNIGTHQYLIKTTLDASQKLLDLGTQEQVIIHGLTENGSKVSTKDQLKIVADVLASRDYTPSVKRRFAMLAVASMGADKAADIVKLPGLSLTDKGAIEAVAKFFDIGAQDKTARAKRIPDAQYPMSCFKTYVKTIMEQAATGTLPTTTFPVVSGDASGGPAPAAEAPKAGGLFGRPKSAAAGASGKVGSIASTKAVANLDLGHGTILPLNNKGRIWVYIIGGATRSEIRSAYEIAATLQREVIVGSTSVISPDTFIATLQALT